MVRRWPIATLAVLRAKMAPRKRIPQFELDCVKTSFNPRSLGEVKAVVKKIAGEEPPADVPIFATDYADRLELKSDEDVAAYFSAPLKKDQSRLIKFSSQWLVGDNWTPKTKVTCKGDWAKKFFCQEEVSTREVEISLKFFEENNRFRLKQRLRESGRPYVAYFEGGYVWHREKVELYVGFKYIGDQTLRPGQPLEAVHMTCTVHFADSAGMQLNGYIPSIVGKEPTCWVELCREPDKVRSKTNFNFESAEDGNEEDTKAPAEASGAKPEVKSASVSALETYALPALVIVLLLIMLVASIILIPDDESEL